MHRARRVFGWLPIAIAWTVTILSQPIQAEAPVEKVSSAFLADMSESSADGETVRPISHVSCGEVAGPSCIDACEPAFEGDAPLCAAECAAGCEEHAVCSRQPCPDRWYLSASGAWQQRETVHEVDDPQTFIEFHSGFLANAALGMRFDFFRIELETSFMNNEVDVAGAGGLSSPSPGNVNIRAYMFNVYHDMQFQNSCWVPYVGAGIGTYQSEINGLIPEFFDQLGAPFSGSPVNATSDMPLAYQFRAGVTRPIGCRSEFFSGYRYFKGEELEFASTPFATFAPTFHPNGAEVHAIELGVRVNF
jgi:opacity protein-like surface antigen